MIRNEREYKITRARLERFEQALAGLAEKQVPAGVDPRLPEVEAAAFRSQIEELREEIASYEALRRGEHNTLPIETLDELPLALIQGRVAAGMSQEDLGHRLGVTKQVVQRYEATEYASASLTKLREVAAALGLRVHGEASLQKDVPSIGALFRRLRSAGLERAFVLDRVLPHTLAGEIEDSGSEQPERSLVLRAVDAVSQAFGWSADVLLGDRPLEFATAPLGAGRFKIPRNASARKTHAYAIYAHRLSALALKATAHLEARPIPTEPKLVRDSIVKSYGQVTFESALRWVWQLGVPVLPLRDSAAFYGACWRESGRNVIVLKQNTDSLARWLGDLLHELYHASVAPDLPERGVVDEHDPLLRREDAEEDFANDFASAVALDGRAEDLAQKCVKESKGDLRLLKRAVSKVAVHESVPVDSLANYIAYRLKTQEEAPQDWWSTAMNLQITEPNPWAVARDVFFEFSRFETLTPSEQELLAKGLTEVAT